MAYFTKVLRDNRLAHAYLLLGPEDCGKEDFAWEVAKLLVCEGEEACGRCSPCLKISSGNYADLDVLDPEMEKKSTFAAQSVRDRLASVFQFRPLEGRQRIIFIFRVDRMSPAAQDALLKPLEEPPPDSVLILTGENAASIHPTVMSRCRVLRFLPSPWSMLPSSEEMKSAISLLGNDSRLDPFLLSKKLFGEKKGLLPERRKKARRFLQGFVTLLQVCLRVREGIDVSKIPFPNSEDEGTSFVKISSSLSPLWIERAAERVLGALGNIQRQVTPELVIEDLFLCFRRGDTHRVPDDPGKKILLALREF